MSFIQNSISWNETSLRQMFCPPCAQDRLVAAAQAKSAEAGQPAAAAAAGPAWLPALSSGENEKLLLSCECDKTSCRFWAILSGRISAFIRTRLVPKLSPKLQPLCNLARAKRAKMHSCCIFGANFGIKSSLNAPQYKSLGTSWKPTASISKASMVCRKTFFLQVFFKVFRK